MNPIIPKSFRDAIISADRLLKKSQRRPSWFGKKIYLGYSDTTGWKIHELGLFARIFRALNLAYRDTGRYST